MRPLTGATPGLHVGPHTPTAPAKKASARWFTSRFPATPKSKPARPGTAPRVKLTASDHEESVNGYAVKVLSAAVDPDLAGDEITGLKERLARAGLLLAPERMLAKRPSARALSRARAAAGRGRPLSDFVAEGRR